MGCDIHAHFEIKINRKWEHYSHLNIERNYELFGYIAGVRSDVQPVVKPKGLPDSLLSLITVMDLKIWGRDAHTHTWLNVDEIRSIPAMCFRRFDCEGIGWYADTFGYLFRGHWRNFNQDRENYPKEIEDIRFICWFDN